MPGAFKLDHLPPVYPKKFPNFYPVEGQSFITQREGEKGIDPKIDGTQELAVPDHLPPILPWNVSNFEFSYRGVPFLISQLFTSIMYLRITPELRGIHPTLVTQI